MNGRRGPIERARVVLLAITAAIAVLVCSAFDGCRARKRPGIPPKNLVLVTVGSLRADHLSCYGYRRATSAQPSDEAERALQRAMGIDDLARSGVLFANAYAPSGSTVASLATLFSGRAPLETGVEDDRCCLPADVETLPALFARAGFHTSAFVTSPEVDLERALGRGFDEFVAGASDGETLAAACRWLERDFGDGQPVLLWLHLGGLEPGWSIRPPDKKPGPTVGPRRFHDVAYEGPVDGTEAVFEKARRGEIRLAGADVEHAVDLYDTTIASTLGGLSSFLRVAFDFESRGAEVTEFWARSVFLLTSPHGIELCSRGRVAHEGGMHDDVLRVPLFFRHPDSLTGERVLAEPVELADVLPTLLDWFGLAVPPDVDGRALLARVDESDTRPFETRTIIGADASARVYTARTARWRLVWNTARAAGDELARDLPAPREARLYDHRVDPDERADVAARHPEVVRELQHRIARWSIDRRARLRSDCSEIDAASGARGRAAD
jgi:arylsulfatase